MRHTAIPSHVKTCSTVKGRPERKSRASKSMDLGEVTVSDPNLQSSPKKQPRELRTSTLAEPSLRVEEESGSFVTGCTAANLSMEMRNTKHAGQLRPLTDQSALREDRLSLPVITGKSPRSPTIVTVDDSANLPLAAPEALRVYRDRLTDYEKGEILYVQQVYFIGTEGCKKVIAASSRPNFGFDDERGNFLIALGDHINYRYEVLGILGKGVFGQVIKCMDHKRNELVAIKIITNKTRFQQQGAIEVRVLDLLRNKDPTDRQGVVKLKTSFMFRRHICMVFELLSITLSDFIKTSGKKGVSQGLVRRFALQLVLSLQYLSSLNVIHCDLKPDNILLKDPRRSGIRIIDFGSSCLASEKLYTYIQSRFYRAPEVILGLPYDCSIDMWSLGCVLAELFLGVPLFAGLNEQDQLLCMMEVLGVPPKELIQISPRNRLFFEGNVPKLVPSGKGKQRLPEGRPLTAVLKGATPLFLDFVRKCLRWDPAQRLTPQAALAHRWIQEGIAKLHQESRSETSIDIDR